MTAVPAGSPDHAPGLERAFDFVPEEGVEKVQDVEGRLPDYLRGTYYLNGPARFGRGDRRYGHWLDGDGMVVAVEFGEEGIEVRRRFVRSHKWTAEEEAGRSLFRGFGTAFEGDQLLRGILLASPVNVSVLPLGSRLLAFGEQGLPWELDPKSLETVGEATFGGKLNALSPFSAHPHPSADGRELFNFGMSFAVRTPMLNVYRLQLEGDEAEVLYRKRVPLDFPTMTHDFMLGPRHLIFHLAPHVMDMERLSQGHSVQDALEWRPELGSRLLFVDRETGSEVARTEIDLGYCLHLIAAFETDGQIYLDLLEMDRPVYDQYQVPHGFFTDTRTARPTRYVIDGSSFKVLEKRALDDSRMADFPAVDPRQTEQAYDDFFVLGISGSQRPGRKFFDQLVHYRWSHGSGPAAVWQAPDGSYLGAEPVFVPDPSRPSGGCLICQLFDTEARVTRFLVFDSADISQGPQAILSLKSPVHLGFHTAFEP